MKVKMKSSNKLFSVLISLTLVVSLLFSGCGESKKVDNTTSTESQIVSEESVISESSEITESLTESVVDSQVEQQKSSTPVASYVFDLSSIPAYSGQPYVAVNNNNPVFNGSELSTTGYENYSSLDDLGRCGVAIASCCKETMPGENEERGSISNIFPTGWVQAKYSGISGGYLWNRCHLIGWQLSAENANDRNLITGTRYLNIEGMLPFENMVADYIKETGNHVAYRVTPIYEGNNLVCSGVHMEAYSVEDDGDGICFNVYCYNVQPDISIDYSTGSSTGPGIVDSNSIVSSKTEQAVVQSHIDQGNNNSGTMVWIPTNGGKKYHSKASCSNMKSPKEVTLEEAEQLGFTRCSKCF